MINCTKDETIICKNAGIISPGILSKLKNQNQNQKQNI